MRRAHHFVLLGQVGHYYGGDGLGFEVGVFKGELVNQADRLGALGSGGSGEDFEVQRGLQLGQRLPGGRQQPGVFPPADDDGRDQGG